MKEVFHVSIEWNDAFVKKKKKEKKCYLLKNHTVKLPQRAAESDDAAKSWICESK